MLILICGRSRAGKTTYSQRFENVIHLDEVGFSYERCRSYVHDGDVVVEGVYDKAQLRKSLLSSYSGDSRKCIWLDTPTEIRRSRKGYSKLSDIPFEPPTLEEGWDEIVIIRGENDVECYSRQTED